MFHQLLTPVPGGLVPSFAVAALPIATVLVLMGGLRQSGWLSSLAGLIVGLLVAIVVWRLPAGLAFASVAAGAVFALWPIMWIVVNALVLYNIAVISGRFEALHHWILDHLPNDRRVVLIVVGYCFGALLEGVAGFGTTVAISSALLIGVGFAPLEALALSLLFDTAPVAFGALGVPITTLASVTHLPDVTLGRMVGRQLPLIAFLLPFYGTLMHGGRRSVGALWPVLLVAGGSFALVQFLVSNYVSYALTDVLSSLLSLAATVAFLKLWRPTPDPEHAIDAAALARTVADGPRRTWSGWLPWIVLAAVVIAWTAWKVSAIGDVKVPWPGLDKRVFITLYGKPYAAVWDFQPLATGTAILVADLITAALVGVGPKGFLRAIGRTARQSWIAIVTVMLIIGLAYLMNYAGMTYTLGLGVASAGLAFPLLSAFLGWVAVFLSGSDTSGNALFGNLQVVAAHQLHLNPTLIAATNSSGGVMGKMISPQNITTGVSINRLKGAEGAVIRRVFWHSIVLTLILGLIVMAEQHLFPGVIP